MSAADLPEFSLPAVWQPIVGDTYRTTISRDDLAYRWLIVAVLPSSHTPT